MIHFINLDVAFDLIKLNTFRFEGNFISHTYEGCPKSK